MSRCLFTLCLAFVFTTTLAAQCTFPGGESFDSGTTTPNASCDLISPGVLPTGWTLDASSVNAWRVRSLSTPSTGTGPTGDHTGGGNFVYVEGSGCASGVQGTLVSPCYDANSTLNPTVEFYYHMYGTNMGTLDVQAWDGSAWNSIWSLSGDQGNSWRFASIPVSPYLGNGGFEVQVRFVATMGSTYLSDMAIDDFRFGEPTVQEYQLNQTALDLQMDGVTTDGYSTPAVLNKVWVNCAPAATPATGTFSLTSSLPGAIYDVVMSPAALVPATGGALVLPDGQIVNADLATPPLSFFSGTGAGLNFAGGFPGQVNTGISFNWSLAANLDLSLQAFVFNPAAPLGVSLSQAVELHVAQTSVIAGPVGDDITSIFDVTNAPTCWCPGGLSFYGQTYTQIGVCTNGRVLFGGGDNDWSATVAEALGGLPFVGYWTDLDSAAGGNITLQSPSTGIVRVDYNAVQVRGEPATVTFGIELDCNSGIVTMDGLMGIGVNPLTAGTGVNDVQILGMSGGAAALATDPGAVVFAAGGSGTALLGSDMTYDYNDPLMSGVGQTFSLIGGTLSSIQFIPSLSAAPGYDWLGF